jgi:hypothetical protein
VFGKVDTFWTYQDTADVRKEDRSCPLLH